MKFKLDNEFELIYLARSFTTLIIYRFFFYLNILFLKVLYQSVIQLAYIDKLLNDVHLKFRDLYKNVLNDRQYVHSICGTNYFDKEFNDVFQSLLMQAQQTNKLTQPKTMKTFTVICFCFSFFF